jgi:hypothetical protein
MVITQLGDPQPHLPIADDGRLAGSTGEYQIADPGWDWITNSFCLQK